MSSNLHPLFQEIVDDVLLQSQPAPRPVVQRHTLNDGPAPRCPHAPADLAHGGWYRNDGAHRWGPERCTGSCLNERTCEDCGLVLIVDSSD